jgi:hypothetical protein
MIRSKRNREQYYKRALARNCGGWVEGIKNASVWSNLRGPKHVLRILGKDYAEIVPITGLMQAGEYNNVFAIRHIITGQFVANKKHRNRGLFYTKIWADAGVWTKPHHAKTLIRTWPAYCKQEHMLQYNLTIKPEELEIIKMPVFVPPREIK